MFADEQSNLPDPNKVVHHGITQTHNIVFLVQPSLQTVKEMDQFEGLASKPSKNCASTSASWTKVC
jgi:hypothetical protein